MKKWMIKAVQGTSVPQQKEGLPDWLDRVLDPTRLLLEYRVRMMEDSIPKIISSDIKAEGVKYPADDLIKPVSDIIHSGNMRLLKEVFILLHRQGLTFPAMWLPDLLDAPARERKFFSNLIYLSPSWIHDWITEAEKNLGFPEKAIQRWKRLLLMPDLNSTDLHSDQLLFLIRHEIFNQRAPSDSLLKRAWKKMNTEEKVRLVTLLPDNADTETFLMAKMKTRSATIKHLITLKLMKLKGDFYDIVKETALNIPPGSLMDPDDWPGHVMSTLEQILDLSDQKDIQKMVFLLKPEDLFERKLTDLAVLIRELSGPLKQAIFVSALLHEEIENVELIARADRSAISEVSDPEYMLLSTNGFNILLDKSLYGKWLGHRTIAELMLTKESYFPGSLSLKLVKWLRYEIIDKKPFLAEDILDALSYRADPKIYPELLAMNEQSIYYPTDVVKPLRKCITSMQQRLAFRAALRKVR